MSTWKVVLPENRGDFIVEGDGAPQVTDDGGLRFFGPTKGLCVAFAPREWAYFYYQHDVAVETGAPVSSVPTGAEEAPETDYILSSSETWASGYTTGFVAGREGLHYCPTFAPYRGGHAAPDGEGSGGPAQDERADGS